MTNENRRNKFPSIRLTALALLAALLTFLSGGDNKAQAFTLGERMSGIEIGLDSNQGLPAGVWSDGTTVWALDSADTHLYAYKMNPEGTGHGDRDSDKDIDLHADNGAPHGIWSDGSTVWVSDSGADKIFAYKMEPGETDYGNRDSDKDADLDSGKIRVFDRSGAERRKGRLAHGEHRPLLAVRRRRRGRAGRRASAGGQLHPDGNGLRRE